MKRIIYKIVFKDDGEKESGLGIDKFGHKKVSEYKPQYLATLKIKFFGSSLTQWIDIKQYYGDIEDVQRKVKQDIEFIEKLVNVYNIYLPLWFDQCRSLRLDKVELINEWDHAYDLKNKKEGERKADKRKAINEIRKNLNILIDLEKEETN